MAISNHRIKEVTDQQVRFEYKDYRKGGAKKEMTLSSQEFIRRFSLHILPKRFVRIRHYGIPEQQLDARETAGPAIRFKDQDPGGNTQNAAPEMPLLQGRQPDHHRSFRSAWSTAGISFRYPTIVCKITFAGKGRCALPPVKPRRTRFQRPPNATKKQSFRKNCFVYLNYKNDNSIRGP